jgi:hypothetical protein
LNVILIRVPTLIFAVWSVAIVIVEVLGAVVEKSVVEVSAVQGTAAR